MGRPETRFQIWENAIAEAVRATQSQVGVLLHIPAVDPSIEVLDQLEVQFERIKTEILALISGGDANLKVNETRLFPIINGLIEVEISKPELKTNPGPTSYYRADSPVWYSQQEFRKFGDIVCAKVGQCRAGAPNVLAIGSGSSTHEELDCAEAIRQLERLEREDDAFFRAKKFEGTADFRRQCRNLSAIVFRTSWTGEAKGENFVWLNPDATNRLPDTVVGFLKKMD